MSRRRPFAARRRSSPPPPTSTSTWMLMVEQAADGPLTTSRLAAGMMTGVDVRATMTTPQRTVIESGDLPFAYFAVPTAAGVGASYPQDDAATTLLPSIAANTNGSSVWRYMMPEWDQSGGAWASGRPSASGLSDATALANFINFYKVTKGLNSELSQTAAARGYKLMAVSDQEHTPHTAFEMGADMVCLERNIDELAGMIPGLGVIRGAGGQYGKEWGIDFSTWRYWTNGPTEYSGGFLVTGWSNDTFNRHLMAAYMGGANVVHFEPAVLEGTGAPLGTMLTTFKSFTAAHPARGTPDVPFALLKDSTSGWVPLFGEYLGGRFNLPSKWYYTNAWHSGDRMLGSHHLMFFPGYRDWGTIPDNSPPRVPATGSINTAATISAYQAQLAAHADPRPWEPFGTTRWGQCVDHITDLASDATLSRYPVVVLCTNGRMSGAMLTTLTNYVSNGGTLIVNVKQLPSGSSSDFLTGVSETATLRTGATGVTWVPDSSSITEASFAYTLVTNNIATVVARRTSNSEPIVLSHAYGSGMVYTTTADYMTDSGGYNALLTEAKLIDTLFAALTPANVSTATNLQWLVSKNGADVMVTLINTALTNTTYAGEVSWPDPGVAYTVREWVTGTTPSSSVSGGRVRVTASVPGYAVRVYVLDVT